jgi:hypothetical protein
MGSGKWEVGSGEWEVGSGKWEVGSGKWEVGSGKWGVATIRGLPTTHYQLPDQLLKLRRRNQVEANFERGVGPEGGGHFCGRKIRADEE